jgi:hypothetical protein
MPSTNASVSPAISAADAEPRPTDSALAGESVPWHPGLGIRLRRCAVSPTNTGYGPPQRCWSSVPAAEPRNAYDRIERRRS